jgi:hypothetical protein
MAIKVSAKTVAQLRKGTMAGNLAKVKNASPEMREALVRFYGAKRVNAASGTPKAPASAVKGMPMAPKKVPAQAKRAGTSEASKAKVYPGRPGGTAMASTAGKSKAGTTRVNKPLINVPAKLGSAQAKLDSKAKANAALYAKQQKAAQDKYKQMKAAQDKYKK